MFRRRVPLSLLSRMTDAVWPRPGWRRAIAYRAHRIGRMSDSPHRVAAGLASGMAVALTPLIGLQFILAAILAVAVRGNVVASVIGSFIANPWTMPAIWETSYLIGQWIIPGTAGGANPDTLDFLKTFALLAAAALTFRFDLLPSWVESTWLPMMIGSLPLAAACWIVSYWLCRKFIERYQARRRRRLQDRTKAQIAE